MAAVAAVLASGCANIPVQGRPSEVTGDGQQGHLNLQVVPPVPHPGMTENAIVRGFVAASASFANHFAAARAFLDPQLQRNWQPGYAAAVVTGLTSHSARAGPIRVKGQPVLRGTVTLTAHQVATISDVGRYVTTPASAVYKFKLARVDKLWRITALPSLSTLLLTQFDFQEDYQPRNLYDWTPDHRSLVPEPVFAPQEGSSATASFVARELVSGLLTNQAQSSWLGPDTTSEFRGVKLLGLDVDDQTATVDLGGAAARLSKKDPTDFKRLAAQLVVTLTSTSYSQTAVAGAVTLEVDGRVRPIGGRSVIEHSRYRSLVPNPPSGRPLYFIGKSGQVSELRPATKPQPIQKPLATGQRPFSLIAVSGGSGPQFAGVMNTAKSCDIYYGSISRLGSLHRLPIPIPGSGPCTSLSWDSHGNIWAVTSQSAVWVVPAGSRQPAEVVLPALPVPPSGKPPPSYKVLALNVAPDGVRVAMLIKIKKRTQVALTAIGGKGTSAAFSSTITIGQDVSQPIALSWYDAYHVMVLAGNQLYELPVNGGQAVPAGPATGATMMTAAGLGQVATAGNGVILTSSGPNQSQQPATEGTDPTYPG
jgi:hypothetical protein